jgi:hypothetical protein
MRPPANASSRLEASFLHARRELQASWFCPYYTVRCRWRNEYGTELGMDWRMRGLHGNRNGSRNGSRRARSVLQSSVKPACAAGACCARGQAVNWSAPGSVNQVARALLTGRRLSRSLCLDRDRAAVARRMDTTAPETNVSRSVFAQLGTLRRVSGRRCAHGSCPHRAR